MKRLRGKQGRWAVLLALFALYLQTVIPLAQGLSISISSDGSSNWTLICSKFGARLLAPQNGKGQPVEDQSGGDCAVCMAYAIGANALNNAADIQLPEPPAVQGLHVLPQNNQQIVLTNVRRFRSRAPPISS